MNQKFFELPQKRRQTIINAALHIFAKYDYKKASTEAIAALAGISKGLVFHYFESKKELYLYLYSYSVDFVTAQMDILDKQHKTDFFEIFAEAQRCKMQVLDAHPDLMLFLTKAYFEDNQTVKNEISQKTEELLKISTRGFLSRVDASKFKEEISVEKVFNLVVWLGEGYMRTRTPQQLTDLKAVNDEFLSYLSLIRSQFYKPEYL